MDDALIRRSSDPLLWWLILLVGIHSCVLGIVMLLVPRFVLTTFAFPPMAQMFFPSQSGLFLLILGSCYLRALVVPSFVFSIFVSKTFAVSFLVVHAAFLGAPPVIWLSAAGDAAMLVAVAFLWHRHQRLRSASRRGESATARATPANAAAAAG